MKVIIETIPHKDQRYDTVGDWTDNPDTLNIRVSKMGDWRKEVAVAYHELREALMCNHLGITQEAVDKFDMEFEDARQAGDESEPGDDPEAPYFLPHQYATRDERLLVADLGLSWDDYDEAVKKL